MTNNTGSQQQGSKVAEVKGESVIGKVGGGLSWWINSLMGKPQARVPKIPVANQQPQSVNTPDASPKAGLPPVLAQKRDDSVLQDVESLKKLVGKVSGGVTSKIAPMVKGGLAGSTKAAAGLTQKMGPKFITRVLQIFFVILLCVVIVFVGIKFFASKPGDGSQAPTPTPDSSVSATPTPFVYNPPKASVYATDPEVLKLEEDINVITREVGSTVLRENDLNPPTLDFNVAF